MMWQHRTIYEQLEWTVQNHGRRVAVIDRDRTLVWEDLKREVDNAAKALHFLGLRNGDVVGMWLPNVAEWITVRLALARIGCVLVPLNTHFTRDEVRYCLAHSHARALIFADTFFGKEFGTIAESLLDEAQE